MDDDWDHHLEDTIEHLVAIHEAHQRRATPMQRFANRLTAALGRPTSVAVILLLVIGWMIGNYAAVRMGVGALERFPFPDLAFLATIAALVVALLILTAQRHDQALSEKRAQLTLQIALLSERKIAKLIAMMEEQRRDNPFLPDRIDAEAEGLSQPANPLASLERIEAAHREG